MSLLDELVRLESDLLRNARRVDPAFAEQVLHPEAEEVGRSGRRYERTALLRLLAASRTDEPDAAASGFRLFVLAEGVALLRYRSHRAGLVTERSSLWQRHEGRWTLRFHQGTPAD